MARFKLQFSLIRLMIIVVIGCLCLALWSNTNQLKRVKDEMDHVLSQHEAQSRKLLSLQKFPNRAAAIELVNAGGPRDQHHFFRIYVPIEFNPNRYVKPNYKIFVTVGSKSVKFPTRYRLERTIDIAACNLALGPDKETLLAMRSDRTNKQELQMHFNSECRLSGSNNKITLSSTKYPFIQKTHGYHQAAFSASYEDDQGGILLYQRENSGAPPGVRNVLQVWLQKVDSNTGEPISLKN